MKKAFFSVVLFVFLFSFTFSFTSIHAQTSNAVSLEISPEFPNPGEVVNVKLNFFGSNLNSQEITWSENGVVKEKGIGKKTFTLIAPEVGKESTITAASSIFSQSITIRPVGLDLIFESETYTPPFYRGKALYSNESYVNVVAVTDFVDKAGKAIKPENLVYRWTRDGKVVEAYSGYGSNKVRTGSGILIKPFTMGVEVSTPDKSMMTQGSITISNTQPVVGVYEDHPLYGPLFNKMIPSSITLKNNEISLFAVPYHIEDLSLLNGDLVYNWRMNGQPVSNEANPNRLVLRETEGAGGTANISLGIENVGKMAQFASNSFRITFGK
jgi:hypothetical protein